MLQLEIDGTIYYVDPTLSLQGGSLQTNFFPDYEWGLVISDHSKDLIQLPRVILKSPTEIDTFYTLESEDLAQMKIKSIFCDARADRLRQSLEWRGLKKIEEESLADMQQVYGAVTLDVPMQVSDDRANNIITLIESYRLPNEKRSDKKVMEVFSFISDRYLERRVNPERASPYELRYPLWVKERISIDNAFVEWNDVKEDYKQEHESFLYTLSTLITKNKAVFNLELKHLQDHVPKQSLREYWRLVNDIKSPPKMNITFLSVPSPRARPFLSFSMTALCFWLWIYFIHRKKKSTAQDMLIFRPGNFQNFYAVFNIFSLIVINESVSNWLIEVIGALIVIAVVCNQIIWRRSILGLVILQVFLVLHASFFSYFLLTGTGILLVEKIFSLCIIGLYFSSLLVILAQVRIHLLEKKNMLRSC